MNIDLHNHVIPPTVIDAIAKNPDRYGTRIVVVIGAVLLGLALVLASRATSLL